MSLRSSRPPHHSSHPSHQHQTRPASTVNGAAQDQLWNWFAAVDADRSGSISVQELQRALVNGDWSQFDLDTCQMLMNTFDSDRNGSIGFNEFAGLWKYISEWQNVFRHFDQDHSGSIDAQELANALRSFGYNLSPQIITLVAQKYGSVPEVAPQGYQFTPPSPVITFDRFVRACVVIKTLTDSFQREDKDHDGWVQMNYETFMRIFLSAP